MNELATRQQETGLAISTETRALQIAHWNDIGGYQSR